MGVSRRAGDFIMGIISLVVLLTAQVPDGTVNSTHMDALSQIPQTVTTALSKFNLDGHTVDWAICPACHCSYEPLFSPGSDVADFPEFCCNKRTPNAEPCGEPLTCSISGERKPIKPFTYHDFHDYLAGLLSRPDIERMMDRACDEALVASTLPRPPFVTGCLEADFVRTFEGPEKGVLFINRNGKGRYLFALNVDFFAVEGLNPRSPSASCGIISMACLNLDIEIRYKPENMYLAGVIPGPNEPHLEELNFYLRPLMNDMVDSWDLGIHFTRTACFPDGRSTNSAIAVAVCDLPGARKAAQLLAPTSHYYCSRCKCWHKDTLGNTDVHRWVLRDPEEMRAQAQAWRGAPSQSERDRLATKNGIRDSELWRLPYWNPVQQLVVDPMHCLYEGVVQHHCRNVLQLTTAAASAPDAIVDAYQWNFQQPTAVPDHGLSAKEVQQVVSIHRILVAPLFPQDNHATHLQLLVSKLVSKNLNALVFVCNSLECLPKRNDSKLLKADWATSLGKWVRCIRPRDFTWKLIFGILQRMQRPLQPIDPPPVRIATLKTMQRIREVIATTTTPSWINSVPSKFGDPSTGSLKADEWRTMITIYLPIALISLWGVDDPQVAASTTLRLRSVLQHTMFLVSAVVLASSRTSTISRATAYQENMVRYVRGLNELFPNIGYRPNHHMALHIFDFLLLYGPTHSWWCFPFERLVGLLQRLPTNHRFGT